MKSNCTTWCNSLARTAKSSFGPPWAANALDTRTRVSHCVSSMGAERISESLPTERRRMATRIEQNPLHVMPGGAQLIHAAQYERMLQQPLDRRRPDKQGGPQNRAMFDRSRSADQSAVHLLPRREPGQANRPYGSMLNVSVRAAFKCQKEVGGWESLLHAVDKAVGIFGIFEFLVKG